MAQETTYRYGPLERGGVMLGLRVPQLLGFVVALCRISLIRAQRWLSTAYVQLVQGTPLLILMFLSYFGLSIAGLSLPPLVAAGVGASTVSTG